MFRTKQALGHLYLEVYDRWAILYPGPGIILGNFSRRVLKS